MLSIRRNYVLAVGAAALLSGQAVYAAPVQPTPTVDPLVALSLLGATQSRAAVCLVLIAVLASTLGDNGGDEPVSPA